MNLQDQSGSHEPVQGDLPEIHEDVVMRDGQIVRLKGDLWRMRLSATLRAVISINWMMLRAVKVRGSTQPVMSERALHLAKLFIAHKLEKCKACTAKNSEIAVLYFARWLAANPQWLPPGRSFEWSDLTAELFEAWLSSTYQTKSLGLFPVGVRELYVWAAGDPDGRYADFDPAVAGALALIRVKTPMAGELVMGRDKRRGPFSRDEMLLILETCGSGKGDDYDRAITWILLNTALRPQQLALLQNRDLQVFPEYGQSGAPKEGLTPPRAFQIKITKIKQRHAETDVHILPLSPGCGELLLRLRRPSDGPDGLLFWWLGNNVTRHVDDALKRFARDTDLRSHRLPTDSPSGEFERLPVSARRFRYGVATDRIAQGDSPENVAAFLGHKNTHTLDAYVETSPLIADEFRQATDPSIIPLVRRMRGRLDDPAKPADAPLIPGVVPQASSPGRALRVIGPIGKCGAGGPCPVNPVTSCFGCESFIARPDAPLRELRAAILEDLNKDFVEHASPVVLKQIEYSLATMEQWIEHIDRAKEAAKKKQTNGRAV